MLGRCSTAVSLVLSFSFSQAHTTHHGGVVYHVLHDFAVAAAHFRGHVIVHEHVSHRAIVTSVDETAHILASHHGLLGHNLDLVQIDGIFPATGLFLFYRNGEGWGSKF